MPIKAKPSSKPESNNSLDAVIMDAAMLDFLVVFIAGLLQQVETGRQGPRDTPIPFHSIGACLRPMCGNIATAWIRR
jgi:hypothetical protein